MWTVSPGDRCLDSGTRNVWRLTVGVIPPGDIYKDRSFWGTWCLAVDGFRQAVCNWFSPRGAQATPNDDARAVVCSLDGAWSAGLWVIP